MYHYFLNFQLYLLSILFSFYLSSILIKNKYINDDTSEMDKLEEEMINHCNNYMFQFKYIDELNELDICCNNVVNKDNITTLEIPFLNNKIIMYYDTDKNAFCYYTKGDVIYKYLNVACRKYVIEHNCRHLYLDIPTNNDATNNDTVNNDEVDSSSNLINTPLLKSKLFVNTLFVKKNEKQLYTKNINKFILLGSIEEYEKKLLNNKINVKNVSFSDYLLMAKESSS
jgi:hypothetical protein